MGDLMTPGTEIHYVALLDAAGDTLRTIPLDQMVRIPDSDHGRVKGVDIKISVDFELVAHAQ